MIGIASDHAAFPLKQFVIEYLKEKGLEFKDYGTDVDGDGEVTSGDARLILRASVGLEAPEAWGK